MTLRWPFRPLGLRPEGGGWGRCAQPAGASDEGGLEELPELCWSWATTPVSRRRSMATLTSSSPTGAWRAPKQGQPGTGMLTWALNHNPIALSHTP